MASRIPLLACVICCVHLTRSRTPCRTPGVGYYTSKCCNLRLKFLTQVRTRKATTQLYTNKAHMIAMGTQLQVGTLLACTANGR